MTHERKPCPFCGNAETHTTSSGEGVVYVECAECGACGCSSDTVAGAADAWNTRASLAQPASVPHPGSPEASAMIDSELAAHGWPSNTKNAARAGYKACSKLLAAAPQAPQPAQAVQTFTEGHCVEKRKPGGCQLHNLHCGYPSCDRKAAPQPEAQPHMVQALKDAIEGECDGLSITDAHAKAILEYVLAAPAATQPEAQPSSEFDSPLSDFREGQWWVLELDAAARKNDATSDFKRAVAVVHHLLRALRAHEAEQQAGEAVAWHVVDADGQLMHAAGWKAAAHEHINDALNEYGTEEAAKWRVIPVFTHPQQPLTREQCIKLWGDRSDGPSNGEIVSFTRAIEAAHGITKDTK